jgi:hypothetical protein
MLRAAVVAGIFIGGGLFLIDHAKSEGQNLIQTDLRPALDDPANNLARRFDKGTGQVVDGLHRASDQLDPIASSLRPLTTTTSTTTTTLAGRAQVAESPTRS